MNENLPQNTSIGNLNIDTKNNIIKADFYHLPFYKKDFFEASDYVKFIKSVERLVRNSDEYKNYIGYLKNEIGLDHCMLQPNITDELADIEMHHGPILTLFDYCSIVTNSHIMKGKGVNTFLIAQEVLDEHFANRVHVVMLSKTTHELVHKGKVFIHPDQAWGDLNGFIEKYKHAFTEEQVEIFNEYIALSTTSRSTDSDFLKVTKRMKSYNKNNYDITELQEQIETLDARNNIEF